MKVLIFGSSGLVGTSLSKILSQSEKVSQLVRSTREDVNLLDLTKTKNYIKNQNPDVIIIAAAKVGGIYANDTYRTDFILENLKINMNIFESCIGKPNIKIINLGSSCIYPLGVKNPIHESSFMTGILEPTNSPYAMAKLSAIEIGRSLKKEHGNIVVNLMPTNLYGPADNFSLKNSHVIPGLIHRLHNAKINGDDAFKIWGTGKPLREFLYVDDLSLFIEHTIDSHNLDHDLYNVGSGNEITIHKLAMKIQSIINFEGLIETDSKMPDGNPRKLLDSSRANSTGWKPQIGLDEGINKTYSWFLENINKKIRT
jgi:GDP-L-fucose synthase